jgi:PKD repeat protein
LIDSRGSSVAIQSLSAVKFDASGSSGTGLRFALDFGDGQAIDRAVATHVYASAHTYTVRATVTDSLGRTDSVASQVVVRSVEGSWSNLMVNSANGRYESRSLDISNQAGRAISGVYFHPEGYTSSFAGNMEGERGLIVRLTDGTISFSTIGIDGFSSDATTVSLVMRGGSADGQTLVFSRQLPPVQGDSKIYTSLK